MEIVQRLEEAGIDFACSVPCSLIAGVLRQLDRSGIEHIPVTREEEGVGICAGAQLGGRTPALLMQNSGLGNSINALLSLNRPYRIPLFLLMTYRGAFGERIDAQVPVGEATPGLLRALDIRYRIVRSAKGLAPIRDLARSAFRTSKTTAVLLDRRVWA